MTEDPINQRLTELQTFIMTEMSETATDKLAYLEQHCDRCLTKGVEQPV